MSVTSRERAIAHIGSFDSTISSFLTFNLPSLATTKDIEALTAVGYQLYEYDTVKSLQPKREVLNTSIEALLTEILVICPQGSVELLTLTAEACVDISHIILDLILQPPVKIDVCTRHPKEEYAQLSRLLLFSRLFHSLIPFVVPVCPDSFQYKLSNRIGEVGLKALFAIERVKVFFESKGFNTYFDIHVADVEGLDPAILAATGETSETHFGKTAETRKRIQEEAEHRGLTNISTSSMNDHFVRRGLSYLELQKAFSFEIAHSEKKDVRKSVEQLIVERNRLHNFDGMTPDQQQSLVSNELAGYAAYGQMVSGQSIILSPDAMSAIPAYHFGRPEKHFFTPVFYAK